MEKMVKITRSEHEHLLSVARRYELLRKAFVVDFFDEPATKQAKTIIKEMEKTGKYNKQFLNSLEVGLQESSYFV